MKIVRRGKVFEPEKMKRQNQIPQFYTAWKAIEPVSVKDTGLQWRLSNLAKNDIYSQKPHSG